MPWKTNNLTKRSMDSKKPGSAPEGANFFQETVPMWTSRAESRFFRFTLLFSPFFSASVAFNLSPTETSFAMLPSGFVFACEKKHHVGTIFRQVSRHGAFEKWRFCFLPRLFLLGATVTFPPSSPQITPPHRFPVPNTCWTRVFLNVFFAPDVVFRHFFVIEKRNQDATRGQRSDAEKLPFGGSQKRILIESSIHRRF